MKTAHHRGFIAKHQAQAGERNLFVVAFIIVIALVMTAIAEAGVAHEISQPARGQPREILNRGHQSS